MGVLLIPRLSQALPNLGLFPQYFRPANGGKSRRGTEFPCASGLPLRGPVDGHGRPARTPRFRVRSPLRACIADAAQSGTACDTIDKRFVWQQDRKSLCYAMEARLGARIRQMFNPLRRPTALPLVGFGAGAEGAVDVVATSVAKLACRVELRGIVRQVLFQDLHLISPFCRK